MRSDLQVTYFPHLEAYFEGDLLDSFSKGRANPTLDDSRLLAVRNPNGENGFKTELISKELKDSSDRIAERGVQSEVATGNQDLVDLLRVIRLHGELMGKPVRPFWLEAAAAKRDVPNLELKEDVQGVSKSVQKIGRLQRTDETVKKVTQFQYSLEKISIKSYQALEDSLRATLTTPQQIDQNQMAIDIARYRNEQMKEVIVNGITRGADGGASATDLGKIGLDTATNTFHSTNNLASKLSDAIETFSKRNEVPINFVIGSPTFIHKYSSNTWTGSPAGVTGINVIRMPHGGIIDLPGINGVKAIIDPEIPADDRAIYCGNSQETLRVGDGPQRMDRYWDYERDGNAIKITQFWQPLAVDAEIKNSEIGNRYFGFKATYMD